MDVDVNLGELIHRGGVYFNVKGKTPQEIYHTISKAAHLPAELSSETLDNELCLREELMSTAVGNGIALPHPRYPLLKKLDEQRIIVCFLDNPLIMNAPDAKPVYVMLILLTSSSQVHLKVLSQLAFLFQKKEFRSILEKKPSEPELITAVKKNL